DLADTAGGADAVVAVRPGKPVWDDSGHLLWHGRGHFQFGLHGGSHLALAWGDFGQLRAQGKRRRHPGPQGPRPGLTSPPVGGLTVPGVSRSTPPSPRRWRPN